MKHYNIYVSLEGPAGKILDVPNNKNPVLADNLKEVLKAMAEQIPDKGIVEWIGIKIEEMG